MYTTLISTTELQILLANGQPCQVFDCSFDLAQPLAGHAMFEAEHVAGAVYAHLDTALSAHKDPATGKAAQAASGGRHPLPARETFAAWLGSVGFANGMQAVVYDRQGSNFCGRLWWMLKWAGHDAVAVLDGGLQAWQAAGGAMASGPATAATPTAFTLAPALRQLVTTATVLQHLGNASQTLLDARGAPRYRGEVEPLDPIAGHVPGALNRPFTHNMDATGKFKSPAALKAEFEAVLGGADPATVVHYCGSGASAVPNLLAMELAGLGHTLLYAGSWSEWSNTPGLPVERG